MAHPEQADFVSSVRRRFPDHFTGARVLEVGSYNVNGTIRDLFCACDYTGIDLAEGPMVDLVCPGHLFKTDAPFDTVISCECFEHDFYFPSTLRNIVQNLVRPGGLFVFTCATTGRHEHGTPRTTPQDSPATQHDNELANFYQNRTEEDVRLILDLDCEFSEYGFSRHDGTKDLYFWGLKK